jgi:hypothetical protein
MSMVTTPPTTDDINAIVVDARTTVRDMPKFFEETYAPLQAATIKLAAPLISTLEVRSISDRSVIGDFSLDQRNGVLKLHNPDNYLSGIHTIGYHYTWFTDDDLAYYAGIAMGEVSHDRNDGITYSGYSNAEQHLVAVGTVTWALWSLVTEFATDIDISTPEGISIPAHQRFQQVLQLFQFWKQQYNDMAAALNLGLFKIEGFKLRRVSLLTNRLVPLFRDHEVDDPYPPIRVFPPVDPLYESPDEGGPLVGTGLGSEYGVTNDGWETIGWGGG